MANEQEAAVVVPTEAPVPVAPAVPTAVPAAPVAAPTSGGVVAAAEQAAKAVETKAVKFATEDRIEITAEEKLFATRLENEFLKANLEKQRQEKIIENAQKSFPQFIDGLVKKYAINPITHQFHNLELAFTKKG